MIKKKEKNYGRHADHAGKNQPEASGTIFDEPGVHLCCASVDNLTEEEQIVRLKDDLEIALRSEGEDLCRKVRAVMMEAWERGETAGFLSGMRAGARVILSLTGEGEIMI